MRVGALFAGVGGLEQGLAMVLPGTDVAWVAEIEPAACRVLAYRYPAAPNLGDVTTIDWPAAPPVDVLTGGWPCQPFSLAGKRKGAADARALWPYIAEAIRRLRPGLVLLENVAAIASARAGELERATADLAALGYLGSWRCLRASEVGATHHRARIFIVARPDPAHPEGDGPDEGQPASEGIAGRVRPDADVRRLRPPPDADEVGLDRGGADGEAGGWAEPADGRRPAPPDAGRLRGDAGRVASAGPAEPTERSLPGVSNRVAPDPADADRGRRESLRVEESARLEGSPRGELDGRPGTWGQYEPAIARWAAVLGRPEPESTIVGARGGRRRLSGAFTEWMMGYPAGWVTDVPGLTNNDALRLCGNGVVPQQAAAALRLLLADTSYQEAVKPPRSDSLLGGDAGLAESTGTFLPTPVTAYSSRTAEEWRKGRPAGNGATRNLIGDLRIVVEELTGDTA